MEVVKTVFLLTFLTVIFVFIGAAVGGQSGMLIAFLFAGAMNFYAYFYSDKMVLKRYNAIEVDYQNASGLMEIVDRLVQKAQIPRPKVYIIPESMPNAFATGRNPSNAAIAVTEGLLELLEPDEVEGVIAHELAHVKHYDILTGTVAATIAGAIAMLANIMQFGAMFGSRDGERGNPLLMIAMSIILPIAASIIQMSISRSREYAADRQAALMTSHPEWLQSALSKLEDYARRGSTIQSANPQTAHMFIINPFRAKNFNLKSLFLTHPSTQDRIARLEEIKRELKNY